MVSAMMTSSWSVSSAASARARLWPSPARTSAMAGGVVEGVAVAVVVDDLAVGGVESSMAPRPGRLPHGGRHPQQPQARVWPRS